MDNNEKPLVTFALFAYNQEDYIREAIEGAFSQTYEPLEIILSDDCSTDQTFEIMQEMIKKYKGSHVVLLNRNDLNLGIGGHINKLSSIASGEIIVMAAGDDISNAERVVNHIALYDRKTYAVFSDVLVFNDSSSFVRKEWLPFFEITLSDVIVSSGGVATGASYSYRKQCFKFPWSYPSQITNEDRLLPLRASLLGKI